MYKYASLSARQGAGTSGGLEQRHLVLPPRYKTRQLLTTSINPLGQLLCRNGVGTLSCIQTRYEGRPLDSRTSHIESEGNQSSILIGVKFDLDHLSQAVLVSLEVGLEKLSGGSRGEREGIRDF